MSVNSLKLVWAKLQSDLMKIVLRFRQNKVAFTADIHRRYHQILDNAKDLFQRILRRESPNDKLALNTVTYRTALTFFLATRCLVQTANDDSMEFSEASGIIKTVCYN